MANKRWRRIIHIDMDAFYASVEQRDHPELAGQPVVVAKKSRRAVVTAASYEARVFGVRSAMPAMRALRLCPDAVFVAPDFERYKAVSRTVMALLARTTKWLQPLSLDEAYLDVSDIASDARPASGIARELRAAIAAETDLAASAGIGPNKFIAKIASDQNKPNGQCTVPPTRVDDFLQPLSVAKIPGVGPAMQQKLAALKVETIADLRGLEGTTLEKRFGRFGQRLHELARGHDERPVEPRRPAAQVSAEDTLGADCVLDELEPHIHRLAEKTWRNHQRKQPRLARTVTLKLKTTAFEILTRSTTPASPPGSAHELALIACALRRRVDRAPDTRYRLVGVGLSGFVDAKEQPRQSNLFNG